MSTWSCMLFQHFDWDLTHQVLRDQPWKMLILWCRTDICTCKISAKVSLMLGNLFLVPSYCKLTCKLQNQLHAYSLQGKQCFFWSHPRRFGLLSKFQHNLKISIKTALVFRLSVSCDYDLTDFKVSVSLP